MAYLRLKQHVEELGEHLERERARLEHGLRRYDDLQI